MVINKTIIILFFCQLSVELCPGQSADKNYIVQTRLLVPVSNPDSIIGLVDGKRLKTIQYFDGLGRIDQVNTYHGSPGLKDIIRQFEYDSLGRERIHYLPFASDAGGAYKSYGAAQTAAYYLSPPDVTIPRTGYPFAEKVLDDSPVNRLMAYKSPGESWHDHPGQYHYFSNTGSFAAPVFALNEETLEFSTSGNYPACSLRVDETVDEDGNIAMIYTDKEGHVLVKDQIVSGTNLRTFYIYNDFGQLAVVISPEGSKDISGSFSSDDEFIENWCYTYKYDCRHRVVEKRIPGMKSPVQVIYDSLDRVILTRDANQRAHSQWYFTRYDVLGRPVLEGSYTNETDTSRTQMQAFCDGYLSSHGYFEIKSGDNYEDNQGYSNQTFPPAGDCEILKVYYYDDYDFDEDGLRDFGYWEKAGYQGLNPRDHPQGMLTGVKAKIMEDRGLLDPWLLTVSFYDDKSRVIQQNIQNYSCHFDTLTVKYNFTGDVVKKNYTHSGAYEYHVITDTLVYDHAGRLKERDQQINHQPQFIMESIHYNELGQMTEKNLHGTTGSRFLQSEDYSYNIRGWLTGINDRANGNDSDDVFVERIHYDTAVTGLGGSSLYNGNISSVAWWHHGSSIIRGYSYAYDGADRLTGAAYGQYSGNNWTVNDHYSVPQVDYDRNGNITSLQRYGYNGQTFAAIDVLEYDYTGNRLVGVDDQASIYYGFKDNGHYYPDGGDEYGYDANGNMIFDLNKGITGVEYNHLNLPEEITLENNRRITYLYSGDGVRLQKKYYEDNRLMETTDYAGGFIYKDHHLDHILTGEGRLKWNDDDKVFYAEYFIKDHLGNVRAVITTDPEHHFLAQGTDYYPFGLEIYIYGYSDYNQLKYNAKELQTEADLTWYDYGARFYDPMIGRWHMVDPLAESSRRWSLYTYCMNNPIRFIDPDGMAVGDYIDKKGNVIGKDGKEDQNVHIVKDNASIETIKINEKAGETTELSKVTVDFTTTQTELAESLDVLGRTKGFAEETSVVTPEGKVFRGETGKGLDGQVSSANIPIVEGDNNTLIHSHPTATTGTSYFNALVPGPKDPSAFQGFKLNIIVGPLGVLYQDALGKDIPRVTGAAFFSRNIPSENAVPLGTLSKGAMEKVLKKLKN